MKIVVKCSVYINLSYKVHVYVCNSVPLKLNPNPGLGVSFYTKYSIEQCKLKSAL